MRSLLLTLLILTPVDAFAGGRCVQSVVVRHQKVQQVLAIPVTGQTLYVAPSVGQYGQVYGANPNLALAAVQDQQSSVNQSLQAALALQSQALKNQTDLQKLQLANQIIQQTLAGNSGSSGTQQLNNSTTFLSRSCSKCHSGAQPKGGVLLDGTAVIDDALGMRITQILSGRRVPAAMQQVVSSLSRDQKNGIMGEILQQWEKNDGNLSNTLPEPPPLLNP